MPLQRGVIISRHKKELRTNLAPVHPRGSQVLSESEPFLSDEWDDPEHPLYKLKRLGSAYRSGRADCWVKVKNPAAPAVRREAEEDRN
jgi:hypothetical protein